MIKGIIFDMDGVLVNSEELHLEFGYKFFRNLCTDIDVDFLDSFRGRSLSSLVKAAVEKYNITIIPEDKIYKMLGDGCSLIYTQNPKLKLCNGVLEWLEYFDNQGLPMIIASSSFSDNIDAVIERFGLEKYFPSYISREMVEHAKPEPEIFIKAAQKLGLKPEECLVIEDSENGIKAAKAANCKVIGYLYEGKNPQDIRQSDMVFDTFGKDKIPMLQKFIKMCNYM